MKFLAVILAMVLPLLACAETPPAKPAFEEGVDYDILTDQPKPAKTGPITVTEVFWYGCGHCYKFESLIQPWKKNLAKDVEFIGSPAMWKMRRNPEDAMWTHAKLFYTASALGTLEKLHPVFFDAMHKQGKQLTDLKEIAALVSAQGLDGEVFVKTMDSFAVNAQVNLADSRQRNYKITGTPEVVVAGYYHVSTAKAKSQERMLQVVDYLVEKVRSER